MDREIRLRFLSIVNVFNCLVCVRRLLPLIPPPTGLVVLVKESLFFLLHTIVVMVILYSKGMYCLHARPTSLLLYFQLLIVAHIIWRAISASGRSSSS